MNRSVPLPSLPWLPPAFPLDDELDSTSILKLDADLSAGGGMSSAFGERFAELSERDMVRIQWLLLVIRRRR